MPMLEIRGLDVFYDQFQALSALDIDVEKGQIVSFLGANSAGKTTLLNTVIGILKPSSGTITFDGKTIGGLASHHIVSMGMVLVPQGRKIFSNLTVRENLVVGSYTPRARKTKNELLEKILRIFPPLKARIRQRGTDLSGGEQQMLAIGRALMSRPRFIMFDEISLGLSPLVVKELYKTVNNMNEEGMTLVLVEQDVKRSLKVSDFAYILLEGKITLKGKPKDFVEEEISSAYFGI